MENVGIKILGKISFQRDLEAVEWYRRIWFKHAALKYTFITNHNRYSKRDRISNWNARLKTYCAFCGSQVETRNHLFFSCTYSTQVWESLMSKLLKEKYSANWDHIVSLLCNSCLDKTKLFLLRYAFQSAMYHIWGERNMCRHGETPLLPKSYR